MNRQTSAGRSVDLIANFQLSRPSLTFYSSRVPTLPQFIFVRPFSTRLEKLLFGLASHVAIYFQLSYFVSVAARRKKSLGEKVFLRLRGNVTFVRLKEEKVCNGD